MKIISRLVAVVAAVFILFAFMPDNGTGMVVSASKKGLTVNKTNISPDWNVNTLLAELGSPDSIFEGYNKLHIYQNTGIVVFEKMLNKKASGKISEIQFFINKEVDDNVYKIKKEYIGKLKLDKLSLDRNTSYETAKSKLKKWKMSDSYTSHSYRFAKDGIYVYLMFNDAETSLMKVSIGKDDRK